MYKRQVFNSVSFVDGKKYRYEKGDWAKYIQPITNKPVSYTHLDVYKRQLLETDPVFYISYDGVYTTGGTDYYEFRCHR